MSKYGGTLWVTDCFRSQIWWNIVVVIEIPKKWNKTTMCFKRRAAMEDGKAAKTDWRAAKTDWRAKTKDEIAETNDGGTMQDDGG